MLYSALVLLSRGSHTISLLCCCQSIINDNAKVTDEKNEANVQLIKGAFSSQIFNKEEEKDAIYEEGLNAGMAHQKDMTAAEKAAALARVYF